MEKYALPKRPGLENIRESVIDALDNPLGTPPLKAMVAPGEKVAIIVGDITRLWVGTDRFMPVILRTLNEAGIKDNDVTILIGNGDHRKHTEKEKELIVGPEIYKRVAVKNRLCP